MSNFNILGIDIGKSTFHLVGHDISEKEVCRKKLSRSKLIPYLSTLPTTTVAMESCGGRLVGEKMPGIWPYNKAYPPNTLKHMLKQTKMTSLMQMLSIKHLALQCGCSV